MSEIPEAIERAARALLKEQAAQMGEGWEGDTDSEALADAVAQLEAALPALHEKWEADRRADYDTLKERADALADAVEAEWSEPQPGVYARETDSLQNSGRIYEALAAYREAGPNE